MRLSQVETIAAALLLTVSLAALTYWKNPFTVQETRANSSGNRVSSFAFNKWQVNASASEEEVLVVSVDEECLAAAEEEEQWGDIPVSQRFTGVQARLPENQRLAVRSYEISRSDWASENELRNSIEDDFCVLGVSENITLSANQIRSANYNDDPSYSSQDYLTNIKAEAGHELFWASTVAIDLTPAEEVVIAVVDSGVQGDHEDLQGVLWDDGAGNFGYDFVNDDADPDDDNGHGTHVAGLSAAQSSNGIGISGVMGFQAKIMGVKVLDAAGSGSLTNVVNGIRYAAENGADVINLSLGGAGVSATIEDAMVYAVSLGSTVFSAAGNEGREITANNFYLPGGYSRDIDGAITIGSIDAVTSERSSFSNFSTTYVDFAAPGSSGFTGILSTYFGNAYASLQGTSMATPIVAGAGGLVIGFLRSRGETITPARVEEILLGAVRRESGLNDSFKDGGVLDLEKLAAYLQSSVVVQSSGGLDEDF